MAGPVGRRRVAWKGGIALTLTRKLVYSMTLVAFMLGLFLGMIEYICLKYSLNRRIHAEIDHLRERVAVVLVSPIIHGAHQKIERIVKTEMENPNIHEFVVHLAGEDTPRVVALFGRNEAWEPVPIEEIQTAAHRVEQVTITYADQPIAYAEIFFTDQFIQSELRRYVSQTSLRVALVLVLFLLMLLIMSKKFVGRLHEGIHMIEQLAQGRARHLDPPEENDEIADLIDSVNAAIDFFEREESKKLDLQKQMFHAAKLASIGELAAGVAHEINNPLMVIQGYGAHLLKHCPHRETPDCTGYLKSIETACTRISRIVRGLRVYARSDEPDDVAVPFSVHACVSSCLELVGAIYKTWGVHLTCVLEANRPCVLGAEGKFQQVIMNLLSNARDAVRDAPEKDIHIATGNPPEGGILLRITDSGCGIPEENLAKIYDPFFTTKPVGEGTGLGLGICYRIVQQMNGSMTIESDPGKGTTCTIHLPSVDCPEEIHALPQQKNVPPAPLPPLPVSGAPPVAEQPRILFVDDDPLLREMFPLILADTPLHIEVAASAAEALHLLETGTYELVMIDYCMPETNGVELVEQLSALERPLRIIMLTGGVLDEQARQIDGLIDGCLSKPLTREGLLDVIEKTLGCSIEERPAGGG